MTGHRSRSSLPSCFTVHMYTGECVHRNKSRRTDVRAYTCMCTFIDISASVAVNVHCACGDISASVTVRMYCARGDISASVAVNVYCARGDISTSVTIRVFLGTLLSQ